MDSGDVARLFAGAFAPLRVLGERECRVNPPVPVGAPNTRVPRFVFWRPSKRYSYGGQHVAVSLPLHGDPAMTFSLPRLYTLSAPPDDQSISPAALPAKLAARYIGMSESWLWRSDVPRVRMGSRVNFLVSDLDAYLVQRRSHGAAA